MPVSLEDLRAQRQPGVTMQKVMREALRSKLDMPIGPVQLVEGTQIALSVEEMGTVYENRRQHMAGRVRTLEWAIGEVETAATTAACPLATVATQAVAVAFWHSLPGKPLAMPKQLATGLRSAMLPRHGWSGFKVELYTYQKLQGLPQGLVVKDARALMPEEEFVERLGHGVRVAHLADLLRAKALQINAGGWFLDCDTVRADQVDKLNTFPHSQLQISHCLCRQPRFGQQGHPTP